MQDRIYRLDVLETAYAKVRRNDGSPGIDSISFEDIEQMVGGLESFLSQMQHKLKTKSYNPKAVRRDTGNLYVREWALTTPTLSSVFKKGKIFSLDRPSFSRTQSLAR